MAGCEDGNGKGMPCLREEWRPDDSPARSSLCVRCARLARRSARRASRASDVSVGGVPYDMPGFQPYSIGGVGGIAAPPGEPASSYVVVGVAGGGGGGGGGGPQWAGQPVTGSEYAGGGLMGLPTSPADGGGLMGAITGTIAGGDPYPLPRAGRRGMLGLPPRYGWPGGAL